LPAAAPPLLAASSPGPANPPRLVRFAPDTIRCLVKTCRPLTFNTDPVPELTRNRSHSKTGPHEQKPDSRLPSPVAGKPSPAAVSNTRHGTRLETSSVWGPRLPPEAVLHGRAHHTDHPCHRTVAERHA
jgi:hypothetical protein